MLFLFSFFIIICLATEHLHYLRKIIEVFEMSESICLETVLILIVLLKDVEKGNYFAPVVFFLSLLYYCCGLIVFQPGLLFALV